MKSNHEIFADKPLRLATRQSKLALIQTQIVATQLGDIAHDICPVSTSGDQVLDRPLVEIGGKGVFIKALEAELLKGSADAAIHSFKDMETIFADNTAICAILPREDRRDALVGNYDSLEALPEGAVIGTSSVRRAAILRNHRPDLKIQLLRGNVQRRLQLLEDGHYDAIILAMAGLKRLGLAERGHPLDESIMMPSASQGAIAVQMSTSDTKRAEAMKQIFGAMHCEETQICTTAERSLLSHLDGSCRTPIGVMAQLEDNGKVSLSACVLNEDGSQRFDASGIADITDVNALGIEVGDALLSQCGGRSFLA